MSLLKKFEHCQLGSYSNYNCTPREPKWFFGKGSQQKMFLEADRSGHEFFVAEQILIPTTGKPSLQYASFDTIDSFLLYEKMFEDKTFFELIRENTHCKEYYDIDEFEDWGSIREVIVELLRLRQKFFESDLCPILPNDRHFIREDVRFDQLFITEACNGNKLSLHVIIDQPTFFQHSDDLQHFMVKFNEFIGTQASRFKLDLSVYRRNSLMRTLDSAKVMDMKRKLKRWGYCKKIKDKRKFYCTYHEKYVYKDGSSIPMHAEIRVTRNQVQSKPVTQLPKLNDVETYNVCRLIVKTLKASRSELYDDWFRVGAGLNNILNGSEEGLDLFIEFSRKCPEKFDLGACEELWKNFSQSNDSRNKKITLGTLMYMYNCDKVRVRCTLV